MPTDCFNEESPQTEPRFRATRHPHAFGVWCYRQKDGVYEQLRVGSLSFAEGGSSVCAIADIVDVKPDKVLAFLQEENYITPEQGVAEEGIAAAIEHFGGSCLPAATTGFQTAAGAESIAALREHLSSDLPAIVRLDDPSEPSATVVAVGYDAEREEVLLFDPRSAERDGWYPWAWLAGKAKAFLMAAIPEDDRYTPRSIFKRIYGIDIAGHEQRWPNIDLETLQAINPSCLGWIHLGGTPLSYPIVKDRLDSTYYQNHNFSGEPSVHGAVSLSFANGGTFDAPNLVFSAHRMRDYSMFKMLTFYDRPDFSEENPFIDLILGAHLYRARVFSAYHFPKRRDESSRVDFASEAEFEDWVRQRIELSMHPFPALPRLGKVATFRTCYGLDNDKMFVVHALLERADDTPRCG